MSNKPRSRKLPAKWSPAYIGKTVTGPVRHAYCVHTLVDIAVKVDDPDPTMDQLRSARKEARKWVIDNIVTRYCGDFDPLFIE